jgi:hypothetical protein
MLATPSSRANLGSVTDDRLAAGGAFELASREWGMGDDSRLAVALANLQPTDWKPFEAFASVFLVDDYPDLRVIAGTGDKGRDAIFISDASGVVAQYSVEANWRSKINQTIGRLRDAGISFTVLIYATNQPIEVPSDQFRRDWRDKDVELDIRGPAWFLPRIDRSMATRNAAASLSRLVVDRRQPSDDAVRNSPLSSSEMREGLLYIELQLADASADRDFTKLVYESLALRALAAEPERRLTRGEIVAAVAATFPGHDTARVRSLVNGALQRLQLGKERITYQRSSDSFAIHHAARAGLVERAANLAAERLGLRSEVALVVAGRETDLELGLHAADSGPFLDVIEEILETLLERQGSEFAAAVGSGTLSVLPIDLYDLAKAAIYPRARALRTELNVDGPGVQDLVELAGDAVGRLIDRPGEAMQSHLRRLADAYTLLAFLQQTPDVQSAVAKLFSRGTLVLDTTVVLPVFVETALPPEEQRYTNLLRAAASAGLQLVVTPGVINEIQTHLERGLACERAGDRWEGDYPFVYRQWLARWPNRQSYASLLGRFMGRDDAERDLRDFLGIQVGIKLIDLAEQSRAFGLQVAGVVSEAWRERKQRHAVPLADPMALDIRVNHDVEMYLGVMSMRQQESPSVYGHEAWLVTTDSTAFRMPELLAGGDVPFTSSPAMHPNFLTNLLAIGPSRTIIKPSVKRLLPVALNIEESGWGVPGLSAIAATIRAQHSGEPEYLIRRRLREAMDRLKSGRDVFQDAGVSNPALAELARSDPLEVEA